METKHHKVHHPPSMMGLLMNIIQAINSLKHEKTIPSKCYACEQEMSIKNFRRVNQEFARFPADKFAFIIENMGLSGLDVAPEFFTDGSINICSECLRPIEREYESPWIHE